jgi:hypothetical protein
VHTVTIFSSSSSDRELERRSATLKMMELMVAWERCCLFNLFVEVKASKRMSQCSNEDGCSRTNERAKGTESVTEEDSNLISTFKWLSQASNGEGTGGDLGDGFDTLVA